MRCIARYVKPKDRDNIRFSHRECLHRALGAFRCCRDALIECDSVEKVLDTEGNPLTRWDGRTTKPNPVTGKEVPDETARIPVYQYINPRKAEWPETDYIVGNPPFIGPARMRDALGDGYTETVFYTVLHLLG